MDICSTSMSSKTSFNLCNFRIFVGVKIIFHDLIMTDPIIQSYTVWWVRFLKRWKAGLKTPTASKVIPLWVYNHHSLKPINSEK
jgi:hypothetical protein